MNTEDIPKKISNKIFVIPIIIFTVFLSYYFVNKKNNLPQTTNNASTIINVRESKIVFSRLGEIITMDLNGNDQTVLVGNNGCSVMAATSKDWSPDSSNWSPAWSPDGNSIAYISAKIAKNNGRLKGEIKRGQVPFSSIFLWSSSAPQGRT